MSLLELPCSIDDFWNDHHPILKLAKGLFAKLFGDNGYIFKALN